MLEDLVKHASRENADLLSSGIVPPEMFSEKNQLARAEIIVSPRLGGCP
jgi:hypothetical protein